MEIYLVIYPQIRTPIVYDSLEKAKDDLMYWKKLYKDFIIEEKEMSFKYKANTRDIKEVYIYKTKVR